MENEEKTKTGRKVLKGVMVIIVILLLLFVGFAVGKSYEKNKSSNTEVSKVETKEEEKEELNTEDIEVNENTKTEEKTTPAKTETTTEKNWIEEYKGYWFNIEDLRSYVNIKNIKGNEFTFDLELYRCYGMENVKVKLNNNTSTFKYKDEQHTIEGNITLKNDMVYIDITKSTFEYIPKGEKFEFDVQMNQKAFDKHMEEIAKEENNEE